MPVDAVIVQVLRAQGAIPGFCRTNIPQTMLSFECSNPIYGQTANPHDTTRGPGGSSGGEGCLIASGGSLLGIGTDIGGSVRAPAHFCGVAGFKPTPQRVTKVGQASPRVGGRDGQNAVRSVAGPLARRVGDLTAVMRCWWGRDNAAMRRVDPFAPKQGFSDAPIDVGAIRVGVFHDDGWFEAAPSCVRAVREAEAAYGSGMITSSTSTSPGSTWTPALTGPDGVFYYVR